MEGLADVEYKKYVLLAYLKRVRDSFADRKLYPPLADLLFHYRNLVEIRQHKQLLYEQFPRQISRVDFEQLKVTYEHIAEDDEMMQQIEELLVFAMPRMGSMLEEGQEMYDWIEQQVELSPVGISPLQLMEGYLFVSEYNQGTIHVYQYALTVFQRADERWRGLHLVHLTDEQLSLANTCEHIKLKLVRQHRHLPNPATFLATAKVACPYQETLLPITKRTLVKHLSRQAA